MIAPSHGPVYDRPAFILDAYRDWISDAVRNEVVLPYISMHGSTQKMVDRLVSSLAERGVKVHLFDLTVTDIGKLAIALVDAAPRKATRSPRSTTCRHRSPTGTRRCRDGPLPSRVMDES